MLYVQERIDEAADVYRRALNVVPNNPAFHYHLGQLLFDQGDLDSARQHIQRAKQLGYNVPPEMLRELK